MTTLDSAPRDLLFSEARTHYAWLDQPVSDALLHELYDLTKMGPTSANLQPLRLVFVRSPEAKARLLPALMPANVDKVRTAPVTVIVAHDRAFHEQAGKLMPVMPDLGTKLAGLPDEVRNRVGLQSATLQAGYLIIAARALGLDAGPMGGFDAAQVDAAFLPDGKWTTSLLVNLGHGDRSKVFPRQPRLAFEDAARIV